MAGIYVHIPFCRRACHYCDFHFTTNLSRSDELVDAILKELALSHDYLNGEKVETIYFGGGTPSLLTTVSLARILEEINRFHSVDSNIELTLEANPEDLSDGKLKELKSIGINRLSLGTQSFIDNELKWMNRMHTAGQAKKAISDAQTQGFDNISIDLIFGLPQQTEQDWQLNLETAIALNIQHISSYSLTIEPKTVLHSNIKKGKQQPPDENNSARFFQMNMEALSAAGFEHYEISNYARTGFISKHNSSYWHGVNYLGIGPSAHSFNGTHRQWNVRSNAAYMANIKNGKPYFETETLSITDKINEQILTGLRTKWGVQRQQIERLDENAWKAVKNEALKHSHKGLRVNDNGIFLTEEGMLIADNLTAALFI